MSPYDTTNEMWDKLEVAYEGSTKVKKPRIGALVTEYLQFKMNNDDGVKSIFSQFRKIINELRYLLMIY